MQSLERLGCGSAAKEEGWFNVHKRAVERPRGLSQSVTPGENPTKRKCGSRGLLGKENEKKRLPSSALQLPFTPLLFTGAGAFLFLRRATTGPGFSLSKLADCQSRWKVRRMFARETPFFPMTCCNALFIGGRTSNKPTYYSLAYFPP